MRNAALLGIGHGINDCVSGFLLALLFYHSNLDIYHIGLAVMLYNLLAFGGQVFVAQFYTKLPSAKFVLAACFSLQIIALQLFTSSALTAVIFIGVSSAFLHIIGGMHSVPNADKAKYFGIFTFPGVLGLIIGGYLGYSNTDFTLVAQLLCIFYISSLWLLDTRQAEDLQKPSSKLDKHDLIMIVLISVLCLRSLVWDVVLLINEANYTWLIAIAVAASLGKLFGGFASDYVGHLKYSIISLVIAFPLLSFLRHQLIALCIGVFFLQSTLAPTTVALVNLLKENKVYAIALSLGVTVLLPILLFFSSIRDALHANWVFISSLLISAALLIFILPRVKVKNLN